MKTNIMSIKLSAIGKFMTLVCTFLLGVLISYNALNLANKIEVKLLIPMICAMLLFIFSRKNKWYQVKNVGQMFVLFCATMFISSVFKGDMVYIASSVVGIITFYMFCNSNFTLTNKNYKMIFFATLAALLLSMWRYDMSSLNSQGVVIAFGGIILLNYLCQKDKCSFMLFVVSVVSVIILLTITRSRTSMAGFFAVVGISYIYLFMRKKTIKNYFLLITILILMWIFAEQLEVFITNIFFHKWGNADITSGRGELWGKIVNDVSLFGHGTDYAEYNKGIFIFDAHNTFLQVMNCFGLIVMIPFVMLIVNAVRRIYMVKNKIIYINFFSGWMIISLFENLDIFTSRISIVTILFFIHVSMLEMEKTGSLKRIDETKGVESMRSSVWNLRH